MTYLEGLPSYFWLVSSRLKKPVHDDVPYTTQALRQDLLRRSKCVGGEPGQPGPRRNLYLFDRRIRVWLRWWTAENRALERAQKGSAIAEHLSPFDDERAVCRQSSSCTADPAKGR